MNSLFTYCLQFFMPTHYGISGSELIFLLKFILYFACVNFFLFIFLVIAWRTIISGSTELIFTICSPNDRYLYVVIDLDRFFPILQGTFPWQPIFSAKFGLCVCWQSGVLKLIKISPFRLKNV